MIKLLMGCIAALGLLYGVKVSLMHIVDPSARGDVYDALAEGIGESASEGSRLSRSRAARRRGDDTQALAHLERCIAEEGEASARAACQSALGELALAGARSLERNLSRATELFELAAEVGDPDAQFNLGMLYSAAPGARIDDDRRREGLAVLHMYAASTGGHPGALMAMGYRHLHGYGVPQSCSSASLNYIEVAKQISNVYSEGMPQAVELIRLNLHSKDHKSVSSSEVNLFVQIASGGDTGVAAAIGKRYLLGIEGFKQDYHQAKKYLRMAANRNHAGSLALLGYMHCLGLGLQPNMDTAYSYFVSAATHNDPLGHNGLGFLYFKGTRSLARDVKLAFKHFNESAFSGSADGMYNLASMYLTGAGTQQSFHHAVLYYTQALDRGHTPAAYSLALMHLNGVGTVRDCDIAVDLLKKVCERGDWVSSKLVEAHEYAERDPERSALLFLKLAEAGHEVSQMNAAHLFDSGQSSLLYSSEGSDDEGRSVDARHHGRIVAQRLYEMSAEQGSTSSELRLGDYSYYGWGVSAIFRETPDASVAQVDPAGESDLTLPELYTSSEVASVPQEEDYEAALARYRKAADMTVTGEWMQSFVARGSFNLGFMHQFGVGVAQDLQTAKQYYHRCREVDPGSLHLPVSFVLLALGAHMKWLSLPAWPELLDRLLVDFRVHILVIHLVCMLVLAIVRWQLSVEWARPRGRPRLAAASAPASPPARSASAPAVAAFSGGGGGGEGEGELRRRAAAAAAGQGNVF